MYQQLPEQHAFRAYSPSVLNDRAEMVPEQEAKRGQLSRRVERAIEGFPMIHPQSGWLLCWDMAVLVCTLLLQAQASMVIVFGPDAWAVELSSAGYQAILGVALGFWLTDLVLRFNRAYLRGGYLERSRRKIVAGYMKAGLWVDLACILAIIIPWATKVYELNLLKLLLLIKFWNVYEIDENLFRAVQMRLTLRVFYNLCRLVLIELIWSHYMGLLFFALAHYIVRHRVYESSWLLGNSAYPGLYFESFRVQYVFTLYYSNYMLTTIAYGNITPLNPLETLFVAVTMIPYVLILAYIFEGIFSILYEVYQRTSALSARVRAASALLAQHSPRSPVLQAIRAYLQQLWREEKARDQDKEKELIDMLEVGLRIRMLNHAYQPLCSALLPSFSRFEPADIEELSLFMRERRYLAEQLIFKARNSLDTTRSVYFVQRGRVDLFVKLPVRRLVLANLGRGDLFGQFEFFTGRPRLLSARAATDTVVYELGRQALLTMPRHSHSKEILLQLIEEMDISLQAVGLYCYSCGDFGHLVLDCPQLFYRGRPREDSWRSGKNQPSRRRRQALETVFPAKCDHSEQGLLQELERELRCIAGDFEEQLVEVPRVDQVRNWTKYKKAYNVSKISSRRRLRD